MAEVSLELKEISPSVQVKPLPTILSSFHVKKIPLYTKKDTKPRVKALAPTSVYANADACYSASLCMVSHLYMSIFPIIDISGPFLFHPVCVHS